jgi:acyl carrier protein
MAKTIQCTVTDARTVDISSRVLAMIRDISQIKRSDINNHTTFREIGFDSLDMLALITQCEATFEVSIPDILVARFSRADEVVGVIVSLTKEGAK